MGKKRERLEVIHDILLSVREHVRIRPTRLLHSSNISPQMFKEYIDELMTKGFISQDEKDIILTDKGFEFLEKYKEMREFIGRFGL